MTAQVKPEDPFFFDPRAYPDQPGIYRMLSEEGKALYIGKAGSLRKRLSQYFAKEGGDGRYQLDLLLPKVRKIETVSTRDERDALVLENQLIKREKPRYNIRLRDDKTYPYIRLSKKGFPRIEVSREKGDADYDYYGPYTVVQDATTLVEFITTQYGLRRCPGVELKMLDRPCLYAQIGQCSAPCVKKIGAPEYQEKVDFSKKILSGHKKSLIKEAEDEMIKASEELSYEKAAIWRDTLQALKGFHKNALKDGGGRGSLDVIACTMSRGWLIIVILKVREGNLVESEVLQERAMGKWEEMMSSFILQYYSHREAPNKIMVESLFLGKDDLEEILSLRCQSKVKISHSLRGQDRSWMSMAIQNARAEMSCREATGELGDTEEYMQRVQSELSLVNLPKFAVAIDISHFAQEEPVGSLVVFRNGRADKKSYRHYRIQSDPAAGDVHHIAEIMKRYISRYKEELPDLFLLDGGKPQLSSAIAVAEEMGVSHRGRILAISKGIKRKSGEEQVHFSGREDTLTISDLPISMRFLTSMRDESHRFAHRLNRKRTTKSRVRSPFSRLPGIGPQAEKILRAKFGSMKGMVDAGSEALLELKGLNLKQIKVLKSWIDSAGS